VIGGTNGSANVEVATIDSDGILTDFANTGAQLVTPRMSHAAVVLGSTLYVIGGRDTSLNALDSVEAAPINADGSLGAFATLTNVKLQTKRYGHSADVIGNSIVVVGGQSDIGTFLTSVERASMQ
jgi:hypothetical protein